MSVSIRRLLFVCLILFSTGIGHASAQGVAQAAADATIPPRAKEDSYAALSDEELWQQLEESDRTAVIGLKAPGQRRGVWKDKILVDPVQWKGARQATLAQPGVKLVAEDKILPVITVQFDDITALQKVRRLPVIDYIQPLYFKGRLASDSGTGCDVDLWGQNPAKPIPYTLDQMRLPGRFSSLLPWTAGYPDVVPWNYDYSHIPEAWARGARGAGIRIAAIDTGYFVNQTQLVAPNDFANGLSGPHTDRSASSYYTVGSDPFDRCSHGTRLASTIAAPLDGRNIVGVAWKSDLLIIKGILDVVLEWWSSGEVVNAIRIADGHNAKIIAMAFGRLTYDSYIADEIRRIYYSRDVLFVGAAGSVVCSDTLYGVVFPARLEEVIAVAGLTPEYTIHPTSCFGPEVDLAAVVGETPAAGPYPTDIIHFGASSDATAVVSGIAALVWSYYPNQNRDWVRDRLYYTTGKDFRDDRWGWGLVNAYRAVGGLFALNISGPSQVQPYQPYRLTVSTLGADGPFSYRWLPWNETTTYIDRVAGAAGTSQTWSVQVTDTRENKTISISRTVRVPAVDVDPCITKPWLC